MDYHSQPFQMSAVQFTSLQQPWDAAIVATLDSTSTNLNLYHRSQLRINKDSEDCYVLWNFNRVLFSSQFFCLTEAEMSKIGSEQWRHSLLACHWLHWLVGDCVRLRVLSDRLESLNGADAARRDVSSDDVITRICIDLWIFFHESFMFFLSSWVSEVKL